MTYKRSLAAVAAVALVQGVRSWAIELPPCLSPFQPFVYSGCYQDQPAPETPALEFRTDLNQQNMTIEQCVAECKGKTLNLHS